jgi:hypothetical protein
MRSTLRQCLRSFRQRLFFRQRPFRTVDGMHRQQARQQPVAFLPQSFVAFARIDGRRCVRQYSKCGTFTPAQAFRRATEVAPCRSIQAHHVAAEWRVRCEEFQDLVLVHAQLDPQGEQGLDELFAIRARLVAARHPRHLHGDGAATAHHATRHTVLLPSTHQRLRTDTPVRPEVPVFKLYQANRKTLRNRFAGRKTPLPIIRHGGAQHVRVFVQ